MPPIPPPPTDCQGVKVIGRISPPPPPPKGNYPQKRAQLCPEGGAGGTAGIFKKRKETKRKTEKERREKLKKERLEKMRAKSLWGAID